MGSSTVLSLSFQLAFPGERNSKNEIGKEANIGKKLKFQERLEMFLKEDRRKKREGKRKKEQ